MLPQEAIDEYKIIFKKKFGVELSDEEASLRANNLVNLYKAVLGTARTKSNNLTNDED